MNRWPFLVVLALLGACSSQPTRTESVMIDADNLPSAPVFTDAQELPGKTHHLACRSDSDAQLQAILTAAKSRKGAVLYFHGGLSPQGYMHKKLGPWLQASLFSTPELGEYYPIFVNYDAGLEFDWKVLMGPIEHFLTDAAGKEALAQFEAAFSTGGREKHGLSPAIAPDPKTLARAYLDSVRPPPSDQKDVGVAEDPEAFYVEILQNPKRAAEVTEALIAAPEGNDQKRNGQPQLASPLAQSQSALSRYATEQESSLDKGREKALGGLQWKAGIAIARALARLALGSGHDIAPTFIEEALTELSMRGFRPKAIATNHWAKVKQHSKECFGMGSAGRKLINGLFAWQSEHPEFQIHTISHSAGSIPTGRLLAYLNSEKRKLNSVQLIVPAINQVDFASLFVPNRKAVDKLRLYVLSQDAEKHDRLAYGIYPASLLYFVSGVAENVWYNDRMLLIEQHLAKKRPYRWKSYQWVTKEAPPAVWDYFADTVHQDELVYYQRGSDPDYRRSASHECTKYPWVARSLAKRLVQEISEKPSSRIPTPASQRALETAQSNCS